MITRRKALAIVAMLAPGAAKRVTLAFDDAEAYAKRYRRALEERGLSEVDPWIAVVDALEEAGALASIDWKTDADELGLVIRRLLGKPLRWPKGTDHDERSTAELLEIFGERLVREHSMTLAHLDIGADEYELVLVPSAHARRLLTLGEVELFTGKNLKGLERARLAKERKARAKEARNPDRQRQYIHPDGRVLVVWGLAWGAEGDRHHAWRSIRTRLGQDWTKAPTTSARERPEVESGFVEVTREEWLRRDAARRKSRRGRV
jgi:hypothetical protein